MKKYIIILILIIAITALVVKNYAFAVDTGALSPGTVVGNSFYGDTVWSNPDNAKISDNTYATVFLSASDVSYYLTATDFGFSVPINATINGIKIEIERKSTDNSLYDYFVRTVKDGVRYGDDKGDTNGIPTNDTYKTFGSSNDLWGGEWSYEDINNSAFGVAYKVVADNSGTVSVDHIRITVYYTEAGGRQATQIKTGIKINAGKLIIK